MKKYLIIILLIICAFENSYAQAPSNKYFDEKTKDSVSWCLTRTQVSAVLGVERYSTSMVDAFKDSLAVKPFADVLLQNNAEQIIDFYLKKIPSDCGLLKINEYRPCSGKYNSGNIIILNGIASRYSYNVNKLETTKMRVEHVMKTVMLPIILQMAKDCKFTSNYIGLTVAYSYKDFSEKYSLGDGESAMVVVPVAELKKMEKLQITVDELLRKCDYYYKTSGCPVVRTELNLAN